MFKIEFTKSFQKEIKKLPKEVQYHILVKWITRLQENPDIGKRFASKKLKKYFKLAFRYKRSDYRMVYQIKRKEVKIIMLAVGTRENFYNRLSL